VATSQKYSSRKLTAADQRAPVGRGLTITGMVEAALVEAVEKLEWEHNHGKPFPARNSQIPKGRKK